MDQNLKYAKYLQAVSNVLHPLLMLTYAAIVLVTCTPLAMLPTTNKWVLVGEVFLLSCLVPIVFILLLYKLKIVGHWALRDRTDRALPLLINAIAYGACAGILGSQGLPKWALAFYIGATILAFSCWGISFWWKISAHAAGISGATTVAFALYMLLPMMFPLAVPLTLVVLTGLLCSIRVYLGRHTMAQVTAGTLLGVVVIALSYLIFG
jgi:membrane-associated phospholipid phosphatase